MAVEIVTAQNWKQKVINSKIPAIVDFSAVNCGFCMMLEPLYNRLSDQYGDKL